MNGAACGVARGRPCVLSSMAQAADTRAASLVPFCAMSASAAMAMCTCPSSNPDSAARIAAVSAFCDPAGRPAARLFSGECFSGIALRAP